MYAGPDLGRGAARLGRGSPLGFYLVVQWVRDGVTRCSGLETFDVATGAFVGRVADHHHHGDLGAAPDGSEFFMTFELAHPGDNNRPSLGYRTIPGPPTGQAAATHLTVMDWGNGGHISCRGPNGVCLVSTGGLAENGWTAFERELFLVHLDGTLERVAHHGSSYCGYWTQARATISHGGRFVAFASDRFGAGCGDSELGREEAFVIDLSPRGPRVELATHTNPIPPT